MRLSTTDARTVAGIVRDLETIEINEPSILDRILPRIRALVRAEKSMAFGLLPEDSNLAVDFLHGEGFALRSYRSAFDKLLSGQPVGWAAYNAFCPEPDQRNKAVSVVRLLGWETLESLPLYQQVMTRFDLDGRDQLRVLVCDGSTLLAWVGCYRREAFAEREIRLLQRLVPALQRRLAIERKLDLASCVSELLELSLEATTAPAFLLRGRRIEFANQVGRGLLERQPAKVAQSIECGHCRLTALKGPGLPTYTVAVLEPGTDVAPLRLARAASQWQLTPRQRDVLKLLAHGMANRMIAGELRCSERTVEIHITAILAKAQCASRGELIARFWTL